MSSIVKTLGILLLISSIVFGEETTTTLSLEENGDSNMVGESIRLNNGKYIPSVGLGTSRIGSNDEEVIRAIKDAIQVGYRHIDTADFYKNEKAIGQALEDLIKEGKIERKDLFITTKVWSNHHTKDLAVKSVRRSLNDLRTDYVDLALVHWPMSFQSGGDYVPKDVNGSILGADLTKENFQLAYQGLEEALEQNLTRSIGVSNFNQEQLEKLLTGAIYKPTVNQVECHPFLNQQKLLQFCKSKDIYLEAYSPLRRGDKELLEHELLKQIAQTHNKTVAQVILRWQLQRNVIVIPKSSKPNRMLENRSIFDFKLNQTEMDQILTLDKNDRVIKFEIAADLPEYPFKN